PENRFASVADFRAALEPILHPDDSGAPEATQGTLEFLLRRMRHKSDFPALSESVSTINKVAQSDKDSIQKLSSTILRDFALTNKILKLVNSAFFRTVGGGSISTVSRAILVLGFDAVRNIAITVMLFEHLQKSPAKQRLMEEFVQCNFSALIARDLGKRVGNYDGELAFICGLFHTLGRILAQFYFPEEADEVRRVMQQKNINETRASAQILGISYEELGIGIARTWGFPAMIVGSMAHLPEGEVRKPNTIEDRLQLASGVANAIGESITPASAEQRKKSFDQVIQRFGAHTGLDHAELHKMIERSFADLSEFGRVVRIDLARTNFGKQVKAISGKGLAAAPADERPGGSNHLLGGTSLEPSAVTAVIPGMDNSGEMDAEGGGADAQSILAAGIQDISNTLVEDFKLNDILRIILETMYRAMGFRRVILCVRDAKSNAMTGRFGFGPDANEVLKTFRFPLNSPPDVFVAALSKGVDILISNIDDEHIRARIPAWYRQLVTAKTFVLLPLSLKGNPVALIYADRENPGEIVIPEKELSLLRTLRNQAVLAIKQSS
ncbi:MAG TPA: HDOD domain-containing protein, partial [Rhodocyclaceae bacterium]|nr:HDOD domain-containing protein [Rhodocyclaceae bacterium]